MSAAPFNFKEQPALDLFREQKRQWEDALVVARRDLARETEIVRQLRDARTNLLQQLNLLRDNLSRHPPGRRSYEEMSAERDVLQGFSDSIESQDATIARQQAVVDQTQLRCDSLRDELSQVAGKVVAMERLREQMLREHLARREAAEDDERDDLTMRRFHDEAGE